MFPLPPREAAVLGELVRLLDARPVTEAGGDARTRTSARTAERREALPASVTEPLFHMPKGEAA